MSEAGPAVVTVTADGLSPLTRYFVWLRSGSGEQPSASAGFLGYLDADSNGHGMLSVTSVEVGALGERTDLSPELLGDCEHLLEIRDGTRPLVAAGLVPSFQRPPISETCWRMELPSTQS